MTDQEINAAIKEATDWKRELLGPVVGNRAFTTEPDYVNDLNAMHDAEALKMSDALWAQNYQDSLRYTCDVMGYDWETCFVWHATARQRAEAFLRTLGKWRQ